MSHTPAALLLEQFDHLLTTPEAVEELNRTILTLAVQGKLVEQDPQDEPASMLLERIKEEKERLTKQGKIIEKTKPVTPIIETELPFEAPKGWTWVKLDELAQVIGGASKGRKFGSAKTITLPYLRVANVQRGYLDLSEMKELEIKATEKEKYLLSEGDLLLTEGGDADKLGRSAIWRGEISECIHQNHIFRARLHLPEMDPEWLVLYTNSAYGRSYFLRASKQTTNLASINMTQLRNCPIPLPPLAEQKRIVARVEALFAQTRQLAERLARAQHDLAQLNQAALAHLLAAETPEEFARQWAFIAQNFDSLFTEPEHIVPLRQAILELAVRGKLVPQDPNDEPASQLLERIKGEKDVLLLTGQISRDPLLPPIREEEIPFDLPQGWEWVKIGHIGEVMGGLTKNSKRAAFPLKMPYLRVANVYANELRLDDIQQIGIQENEFDRVSLLKGDMLVVEGNGSIEQIGRVAIWDGSIDPCVHQNHIIKVRFNPIQIAEYVVYWLLSPGGREQITKVASTTTGLHTLSLSKVSALPIPLPPLAEQKRIVAKVDQLLGLCDALEAKLRAAREARSRLAAAVLAGVGNGVGGEMPIEG